MRVHKISLRRCRVLAAAAVWAVAAPAADAAPILGHTNQDGPLLLHTNQDYGIMSVGEALGRGATGEPSPPWIESMRLPGGLQREVLGAARAWLPAPGGGEPAAGIGQRAAPLPHGNSPALWPGVGPVQPAPGPGGLMAIGLGAILAGRRGRRRESPGGHHAAPSPPWRRRGAVSR